MKPLFTCIQLYDYLVIKTFKYDHLAMKSTGYKKMKASQFFSEDHIKSLEVASKDGLTFLKAAVLASMKSQRYNVVVAFDYNNDVRRVACKCPSG